MLFPKGFTISVLCFLGGAISLVDAAPIPNTNAARLARGLPPARPRFGRNLPGVVREPTPASQAKRTNPSASPVPVVTYNGHIEVRTLDGTVLGNVRNSDKGDIGGINFLGDDDALEVKLVAQGQGPYDIEATNPLFKAPFFVGAGGQNALGQSVHSSSALSTVYQTPQGSPPVQTNGQWGQSAIWKIDKQSKELTAVYVNPDNTKPAVTIVYDIKNNALFFTGDLAAWNANNDEPASAVEFFLV
ncbi:hypothetical protein BDN72DRAFT_418670 [Pluteus cervinus]|uniref:Uncharacterized protein n=1 Tax=Pluteus cervinus TaxID=181527 RepID=A0ACD3AAR8_9AGAR|nr:hypothetical protein BDN72DRAFT_418670 [Pluteus cervinus]